MPGTYNWVPSPDEIAWADPVNALSPQAQGLLGYWPAVASPGLRTTRGLWRRFEGTANGATPIVATPDSELGWAWAMNGSDQYINLGALSSAGLSGITVSAWVKAGALQRFGVYQILADDNFSTRGFQFRLLDNGSNQFPLQFLPFNQAGANGTVNGATDLNDGRWHHVAATWDLVTARVYVDG